MAKLFICDAHGLLTADIEAAGEYLDEALEHELAESVIRCAMLMAVSTLVEGGQWPSQALDSMSEFMNRMRDDLVKGRMH
jgi:hypothetical protein